MEVKDLVEDWIAMRSTLSRQLTALRSGQLSPDESIPEPTMQATISRLESWIGELNAMLKSYASATRT